MKFILGALIVLIASCKPSFKNGQDITKYIQDPENGLVQDQLINGIMIKLAYHPGQLISKNSRISRADSQYYFLVSFSKDNQEVLRDVDSEAYSELVQILSFRMQTIISIRTDNAQPIHPSDCYFQPTYGMSNANTLLFSVDRKAVDKADELIISIHEFGLGTGNVNYRFDMKEIQKISDLQLQQI